MLKRSYFLLIPLLLVFRPSLQAQSAGETCSNPIAIQLCNANFYSLNTSAYSNNVPAWTVGSKVITLPGQDIYYEINLPNSSYQPVSLSADFTGYFPAQGQQGKVYFLWFENSPCTSNPLAVDSFNISGTQAIDDSFYVSYPIKSIKSSYYLVVAFASIVNYHYAVRLGYSNNQQVKCTTNPEPYKGLIAADKSKCFTSANPYHLPLSSLHDNPAIPNVLLPNTLNQSLSYLPINDDNELGYSIVLKSTPNPPETDEVYVAFDDTTYNYISNHTYTVDIVFFLENTGASGIKGFRIQMPGAVFSQGSALPNGGDQGSCNPSGNWNVTYDSASSSCTWIYYSYDGRGDNIMDSGYACQVHSFTVTVNGLGNKMKTWYLSDNYGNDLLNCPRTDCDAGSYGTPPGWVSLFGSSTSATGSTGGGGGGGGGGSNCENTYYCSPGDILLPCNEYIVTNNSCPLDTVSGYDNLGCLDITYPSWIKEDAEYTFTDIQTGTTLYDTICPGSSFPLSITAYHIDYNTSPDFVQSVVVYTNHQTGVQYPVDSTGAIDPNDYNQLISSGNVAALPIYPNHDFIIPLSIAGDYTIYHIIPAGGQYLSYSCSPSNGILALSVYPANKVVTSIISDTLCKGQNLIINVSGENIYEWLPDSAITSITDTSFMVSPASNVKYAVVGTDIHGCMDTAFVSITVDNCMPTASFSYIDTICAGDCMPAEDSSSVNTTGWNWTFTGGTPSSFNGKTPPVICYYSSGTYTVQLIASNNYGSDTESVSIIVRDCKPHAYFGGDDSICLTQCVKFTDSSVNAKLWQWNFPGGNPSSFSGPVPPLICYDTVGTYDVQLIAGNDRGADTLVKSVTVRNCSPHADFSADGLICMGQCIYFTNLSSSGATNFEWWFQGGTPAYYNGKNPPQVCYDSSGNYDVTLVVSNIYGSDTLTLKGYIQSIAFPNISLTEKGDTIFCSSNFKIQWYFNSEPIPGDTSLYCVITTNAGSYSILAINEGGCTNFVSFIPELLGIADISGEEELTISPNPGTGIFNITLPVSLKNAVVEVYNLLGQRIGSSAISYLSANILLLDLSSSPDGTYLVELQTNKGKLVRKIVISR